MKDKIAWTFPVGFGCAATIFSTYCGSGFATGRQLVHFFVRFGWIGMLTHLITWTLCIIGFYYGIEYHRRAKAFNYKDYASSFYYPKYGYVFVGLWDLLMIMTGFVMLSSILASSGELIVEIFAGNRMFFWPGVFAMALGIVLAASYGSMVLMKFASTITIIIISMIILIGVWGISKRPDQIVYVIQNRVESQGLGMGWMPAIWASLSYFGMQGVNIASVGALSKTFTKKRDTIIGVVGGFLLSAAMTMIFIIMLFGWYPEIINETLPILSVVKTFGNPVFTFIYQLLLLGAMITTGAGFTFGFTERMAIYGKKLIPNDAGRKIAIISVLLTGSIALSSVGLITIVAKGYSFIGWMSLPLMTAPLLIIGPYRIYELNKKYGKDLPARNDL